MSKLAAFFGFKPKTVEVKPGSVFKRVGARQCLEIARVRDVTPDPMGIPHVCFDLLVERDALHTDRLADRRTLTLSSFTDQYREAAQA